MMKDGPEHSDISSESKKRGKKLFHMISTVIEKVSV